jgi:putative zinc finger/helix-turn-helix YgiT family protein
MTEPIKELPFPWPCGKCRQQTVERETFPYSTDVQYDGRTYSVEVSEFHAPRCKNCGAIVLDDQANDQITGALRRQVGLLTPEQIRKNRESLGLRQRDFATLLGVGESTVSRWETGVQIQQRSLDKLMRLSFAFPEVRAALADRDRTADLGSEVAIESPIVQPLLSSGHTLPAATEAVPSEGSFPVSWLSGSWAGRTKFATASQWHVYQRALRNHLQSLLAETAGGAGGAPLDEQKRFRFQQLRQREADAKLTEAERAEMDVLIQELEAAEAHYLSQATERLRQQRESLEVQNRALETLARRQEMLARKVRGFLADAEAERHAIESEFAAVGGGSQRSGTGD